MRKLYQKLLTFGLMSLLLFSASNVMGQDLIISEVVDPADDFNGRYVEIYNASSSTIDFGVTTYYLARYANANTTPATIQLTGTLAAGSAYTIANNATNFNTLYAQTANLESGIVTGNGDDTYALYINGDETTGSLHDIYGSIGTDGTGEAWEYLDTRAVRVATSGSASTTWNASDWTIDASANIADMTPGVHTYIAPCTPPTTQASAAGTTVDGDTQITVDWTRGNGTAGVVVLAKEGSAVDATPESGTTYVADAAFTVGDEVGTGNYVVYVGTGTSVAVTGLNLGTDYHFEVFEYNTTDLCYLTPGATASATTTGNAIPELISAATATAETTSDVVLTFSEVVNATDESGISITIDGAAATISSVAGVNSDTWTLTLAETIKANSGEILISYDDTAGDLVDAGAAAVASFSDVTVNNNTTLNIVANLTEARAIAQGQDVEITGEVFVSFVGSAGDKVYVQDSGAGLLIDDNGTLTTAYNSGDGIVNLKGNLTDGVGVMELVPAVDPGAPNSTGNTITPIVLTIADYNANYDDYESRVLKFEELTFSTPGVAFDAGADNYTLTDGVNDLTWRDNDSDVRFEGDMTIPHSRVDIVGLGAEFFGSSQIVPFSLTEGIQDVYAPVFTQAPAASTPTVSSFDVTFRLDEPGRVYYVVDPLNTTPDASVVLASAEFEDYTDVTVDGVISLTGLDDNTNYSIHMVAVDDEGTPNEQATVTTVTATTLEIVFDATTDIVAADAPIGAQTISSVQSLEQANAIDVFSFKVIDDGATDTEPTYIFDIVIENGNSTPWSSVLAGAQLSVNGTPTIWPDLTITDTQITFSGPSPYDLLNGTEVTFDLQVWFNSGQEDGTELVFTIPTNHQFQADVSGSVFKNPLNAAVTSATHTIDVVATELALTNVPASVEVDAAFGFDVNAVDANGNIDTAARTLDLSTATTGTLGGSVAAVAMTNGSITFSDLTFDSEGSLVIDVTDGALTASTSTINVIATITGTIFFSEYFEGSGNNKYVEIYNGTNATIDLSTVELKQSNNGSGFDNHPTLPAAYSAVLEGSLAPGDVYIVYNGAADLAEILAEGDTSFTYGDTAGDRVLAFNGDDAMGLFWNGVLVDLIGDPSVDPGSSWDVAGVTGATQDKTLVRKATITEGNTVALGSFGTSAADSEWEVYDLGTLTYIGFFGELTTPTILANTTSFEGAFGYVASGSSSAASVYTVSAVNLSENLVVNAPSGFELSLDAAFTTPTGTLNLAPVAGEVAETEVFVRFTPPTADGATYGGDILHTSAGADTVRLAVSGVEGELAFSTIAEARLATAGDLVKVTGIVVGGPNNDTRNRAIQDATAGITLFSFDGLTENLVVGDSVVVEGTLGEFRGLAQIQPTTAVTVVAQGKALPAPQIVTIPNINDDVESQLVTVENVKFVESGTFAGGTNYRIATETDTLVFRVGLASHPLVGTPIPTENLTITGVIGQYDVFQLTVETADGIAITTLDPSIVITGADVALEFGEVELGATSAAQSFTVAGSALTEDITVTASTAYLVSTSETGTYTSSLTIARDQAGDASGEVFVKFAPTGTVTGTINGDVTVASSGVTQTVSLTAVAIEAAVTANAKALAGVTSYPNPTADVLHVELASSQEAFTYTMLSLDGRTILRGSANNSVDIKLGQMNAGIYILEVRQDDKVYRARIAKK